MKLFTSMIVGGALMLGTLMAQSTPKAAAGATSAKAPAETSAQTKVKKHRKHKKTPKPATAVHTPAAPTK